MFFWWPNNLGLWPIGILRPPVWASQRFPLNKSQRRLQGPAEPSQGSVFKFLTPSLPRARWKQIRENLPSGYLLHSHG